jgi:L-asparaginase II
VESEHRVAFCVVDGGAPAQESWPGAADHVVFARSAVKPLQALTSVKAGVCERFRLGEEHLAMACASHGGSDAHVAVVAQTLTACGLGEEALACGPLGPRDPRVDAPPSRVRHNCSGKHALGLARCVAERWRLHDYLDAAHPLQLSMRAEVVGATGADATGDAVDGCGMRTFALPLWRLALAFGRLAAGELGPEGDDIARAMRAHPTLIAYDGAIDTELMAGEEGVVAKIGAEGLLCVGLADGRGLALKVLDGAQRAVDPAAVWAARAVLGLRADTPELAALDAPPILNSRGEVVGRLEAQG